jgi:hypothetical protein
MLYESYAWFITLIAEDANGFDVHQWAVRRLADHIRHGTIGACAMGVRAL